MTESGPSFKQALAESLDVIDRLLANEGVPLHMRALPAAQHFVDFCILKVDEKGDKESVSPGTFSEYATSKWFQIIYKETEQWYRERFGNSMDAGRSQSRDAATLIRDTPYLVKVPMTTQEVGTPGESFWLCYHDSVQSGEDVLSWIEHGPIFGNLIQKDMKAAQAVTTETAGKLRAIHIALLGADATDSKVVELRDGILPHLERAARHLVKANVEDIRLSHWDMQMACELTLKCLAQQRASSFKETHDLFYLYDHMPEASPPLARTELTKLPNWERMVEFRYGGGVPVTMRQAFRSYRAALTIVAATSNALKTHVRLGEAKFHLKRPPWMELLSSAVTRED